MESSNRSPRVAGQACARISSERRTGPCPNDAPPHAQLWFLSRADDVELSALIVQKTAAMLSCLSVLPAAIRVLSFKSSRARGLWDENAPLAPDQQHPVKPMAAAPAHQADGAALALRRHRAAAPCRDRIECC